MDYKEKYEQALENLKRIKTANKDNKELVDFIEYKYPKLKESEGERIRKEIIYYLDREITLSNFGGDIATFKKWIAWLEKQCEQNIKMIQWKGDNLREVVEFTGKSPKFNEWFKTWDDYENYVHSHGNIFKLFCEDGSHYEVPEGAWIVKTPDGYNVASKAIFRQKPAWNEEDEKGLGDTLWAIKQARTIAKDENDMGNLWYAENWLKSIKERMKGE